MEQQKIIDVIEGFAPIETQLPYDKCGLKTGRLSDEATGVLICLDLNPDVVTEAEKLGCNLIIEHHPSVWEPLKKIDLDYPKVKALIQATTKNISVYSAHTNIDLAAGGLNDRFAETIGLKNVFVCDEGRIGDVEPVTLEKYAEFVAEKTGEKNVKIIGEKEKIIRKVACINGAGGADEDVCLDFARQSDVFVTAEVKYHVARLSKDIGYAIIEVGHFTSEREFMPLIRELIHKKLPDVPVYESENASNPYN